MTEQELLTETNLDQFSRIEGLEAIVSDQAALIKELEEALEFYADSDNYKSTELYKACVMAHDSGKRARKALGKADV